MKPYYQDEWVTIYHGDCREILPKLPKVDLVITSPCYNLGSRYANVSAKAIQGKWSRIIQYEQGKDNLPEGDYREQQRQILSKLWEQLNDTGAIFYNHKPRIQKGKLWHRFDLIPPEVILRQVIIWARPKGHNFNKQYFVPSYEWIFLIAKPDYVLSKNSSGMGDVWYMNPAPSSEDFNHPAPFPVDLPKRAIVASAVANLIIDPFMGVGSTLVAAKELNRHCIGIEIEEKYCEISANRCRQQVMELNI